MLATPSGLVIYTDSIQTWEPPFHHEEIAMAKKAQIIDNIRRAFRWTGYEINVL